MSTTTTTTGASAIRTTSLRKRREARAGIGFVAPFLAMFAVVFLIPIVVSVYRSFFRDVASGSDLYGGGEKVSTFVGLDNYVQAAGQPAFWKGLGRVLLFGVVQVPVMILAALALALVLDSLLVKRVTVFRLGFFLPYAIPGIVAAIMWLYMYNPSFSPINELLGLVGLKVDFFGRSIILWSMANITTWTFTGYNMLIFLAALQSVPRELYEAARIDGASEIRIFFTIVLRLLAPAMVTIFLFIFVATWNNFFLPLMTINSAELKPVTLGLYGMSTYFNPQYGALLQGALLGVIPLIVLFLGLQRFWQSGLAAGAVKG